LHANDANGRVDGVGGQARTGGPAPATDEQWATWYPRSAVPVGGRVDLGARLTDGGRVTTVYVDDRGSCGSGL